GGARASLATPSASPSGHRLSPGSIWTSMGNPSPWTLARGTSAASACKNWAGHRRSRLPTTDYCYPILSVRKLDRGFFKGFPCNYPSTSGFWPLPTICAAGVGVRLAYDDYRLGNLLALANRAWRPPFLGRKFPAKAIT